MRQTEFSCWAAPTEDKPSLAKMEPADYDRLIAQAKVVI